jgi:Na+/proline symporter
MAFTGIDWIIIGVYLVFTLLIGIYFTRKAGSSLESYFVAGRSLPWWWLGISILATTFAADTPLAVAGITANEGIAGNWLWWNWAIGFITIAIFFAGRWRRSGVLTDVEFVELRYSGKEAKLLRGFKSVYFGLVFNCLILGWVITAMVKICTPFIHWNEMFPAHSWATLESVFPTFLLFKGDLNASITILFIILLVAIYSSLGGVRGVIITDLFQFFIAMVSAILFAWYAIAYVDGPSALLDRLEWTYGAERTMDILAFIPGPETGLLAFPVFGIYMLFMWWARHDSDGSGYIAQRLNTAKTPEDARQGGLLFAIGFVVLRSWPWILVGLVGLVVFPMGNPGANLNIGNELLSNGVEDRELAYPLLMKVVLPAGILGLTFTSLMAAFMSTVDTHLNWGSSYLVNDLYKRFISPEASNKQLIRVSRITVGVITVIAVLVSAQMDTVAGAWKFFFNMATGLGVAQLMRWLWWRANAFTEITGMLVALVATIIGTIMFPDLNPSYLLAGIATICVIACVLVSLITDPVKEEQLAIFAEKCPTIGIWPNRFKSNNQVSAKDDVITWVLSVITAFALLFGIGHLILGSELTGAIELVIGIMGLIYVIKRLRNAPSEQWSDA